jgi:hypothetical protein
MANIQPVTTNDTQAINKVNAAIAEANKVNALAGELIVEQGARVSGDDELNTKVVALVAGHSIYPGYSKTLFTSATSGPPENAPDISGVTYATSVSGRVARVTRETVIAPVARAPVEPGVVEFASFAVRRQKDARDPDNDAVQFGIRWLDLNFAPISTSIIETLSLRVSDGIISRTTVFANAAGDGIDLVYPAGTVYVVPFVEVYGVSHVTDVIRIGRGAADGLTAAGKAVEASAHAQDASDAADDASVSAGQSADSAALAAGSASDAQTLVQQATAGFSGFLDGQGYDFGSIAESTTYFDQDWGTL